MKPRVNIKKNRKQEITAWLMCAPALIVLTVFMLLPFIMAFFYSFTNKMLLESAANPSHFVGVKNYINLFKQEEFYKALLNNIKFSLIVVPVQTSLALILAVIINQKIKFVNFFRTIYFSPVVMSMTVVTIVWAIIFKPDSTGLLNSFLRSISFGLIEPSQWYLSADSSMLSIIILSVWQGVGFQMLIFLSGLQFIPYALYEASHIDGAGKLRQFFSITIPMLKNTMIFVIISTTIFSFKLVTQIILLTSGGPKDSTQTLVYLLYTEGYKKMRIGYASAISVIFFVIVLIISLIQMNVTKADREENA